MTTSLTLHNLNTHTKRLNTANFTLKTILSIVLEVAEVQQL